MQTLTTDKIKFARARYILLFMTLLSIINIVYSHRGGGLYMPFSAAISTYSVAFGKTIGGSFRIICYGVAFILIICLFICYFTSKKHVLPLFIATSIVISDTFVLLILSIALSAFNVITLLDLILHILTVFYLFSGIKSFKKASDDTE